MKNGEMTRKQILIELISLRKRIAELETRELLYKQNEEELLRNKGLLFQRLYGYDEFYAISTSKDTMILELQEQLERLRLGLGH